MSKNPLFSTFPTARPFDPAHLTKNSGMFGFIESDTIEAVCEVCAIWAGVLLDCEVLPVIDADVSISLIEKAIATREA